MNKLAVQRQSRPLLPELSELFSGLPSLAGLRPLFENHLRLEDETKDGNYEVRAELPGVDPVSDVEVTVRDGRLTIKAVRTRTSYDPSLVSSSRRIGLPSKKDRRLARPAKAGKLDKPLSSWGNSGSSGRD